jgi:beta-glucosidase
MPGHRLRRDLTLEQKAELTAGADMWRTQGIEDRGIPALKMTDGPNGSRGESLLGAGFASAACTPCGSALGATWDPARIEEVGALLGDEARTKSCRILLAPTINLHRSPLGGRTFECYSEDPLLSGKIAAAFVRGVQSRGVAATAKHFVANDAETERYTMDSVVDERTLREIYLLPFEIAVREGGLLAIMTGYNRVNGVYCSENRWLLEGVLREQWGFEGIVMTDWFSAGDTVESAQAGLDLQMPGPARFFGAPLADAVREGRVEESAVDAMVDRLLGVIDRLHAWEDGPEEAERSIDLPEHRALLRRTAADATVLLSNDGILPLSPEADTTIALIGPGWSRANLMGGGSAALRPHYRVSPLEVMRERLGEHCRLLHEPGDNIDRQARPLDRSTLCTPEGEPGLRLEFFANPDFEGTPVTTRVGDDFRQIFAGAPLPEVSGDTFSLRATALFRPEQSGEHILTLVQAGRARLLLGGEVLLDGVANPPPASKQFLGMVSREMTAQVTLGADAPVELVLEYSAHEPAMLRGAIVGHRPPTPADPIGRSAAIAAEADIALLLVGTSDEWESEGHDRRGMDLPGAQDELIEQVCAANPRTAVLVNAGAPVTMPWADRAAAIAQCWLGGQEMGNAIVDIVLGDAEPAGRLPTTLPLRLEHNPSFGNFPGEDSRVRYGEGPLVGYRWYDSRHLPVRFPFGHGLSYTSFEIGVPEIDRNEVLPGAPVRVRVPVLNTGARPGAEVVQVYLAPPPSRHTRPAKSLVDFAKIWLDPGESGQVEFLLHGRAFARWDAAEDRSAFQAKLGGVASMLPGGAGSFETATHSAWLVEAGTYELHIGRSVADLLHHVALRVPDAFRIPADAKSDTEGA